MVLTELIGHIEHEVSNVAPITEEYLPAVQFKQTGFWYNSPESKSGNLVPYVPALQVKHVVDEVAPRVSEALPHGHKVHNEVPVVDLYLPAVHKAHGCGLAPDWPAGHENMQGLEPEIVLYVLTAHAEHGPPSGPVNPLKQVQLRIVVRA